MPHLERQISPSLFVFLTTPEHCLKKLLWAICTAEMCFSSKFQQFFQTTNSALTTLQVGRATWNGGYHSVLVITCSQWNYGGHSAPFGIRLTRYDYRFSHKVRKDDFAPLLRTNGVWFRWKGHLLGRWNVQPKRMNAMLLSENGRLQKSCYFFVRKHCRFLHFVFDSTQQMNKQKLRFPWKNFTKKKEKKKKNVSKTLPKILLPTRTSLTYNLLWLWWLARLTYVRSSAQLCLKISKVKHSNSTIQGLPWQKRVQANCLLVEFFFVCTWWSWGIADVCREIAKVVLGHYGANVRQNQGFVSTDVEKFAGDSHQQGIGHWLRELHGSSKHWPRDLSVSLPWSFKLFRTTSGV